MHEQIFKIVSAYGSKIETRVTSNVALIAINNADGVSLQQI